MFLVSVPMQTVMYLKFIKIINNPERKQKRKTYLTNSINYRYSICPDLHYCKVSFSGIDFFDIVVYEPFPHTHISQAWKEFATDRDL